MKCLLTALVMAGLVVPAIAQDRRSDDYSEKYGVLSDKNIFLKDRPRPRPPSTARTERTERPPTPEEPLENRFILRGVVIEDNELRAYVENTRTNSILRLVPGDSIARGHVVEIGIDAIRYEQDGRIKWVEIGHNLAGARQMDVPRISAPTPSTETPAGATVTGAPATGAPATGAPAIGAPATGSPGDPATMTQEQIMRLRRQNERSR